MILNNLIELADKETHRTHWEPPFQELAWMYHKRFIAARETYLACNRDLVGAFRRLQDLGKLEIITTAATFSPRSSSGVASGAFHVETNGSEAHAHSVKHPVRTIANLATELIFASPMFCFSEPPHRACARCAAYRPSRRLMPLSRFRMLTWFDRFILARAPYRLCARRRPSLHLQRVLRPPSSL